MPRDWWLVTERPARIYDSYIYHEAVDAEVLCLRARELLKAQQTFGWGLPRIDWIAKQ